MSTWKNNIQHIKHKLGKILLSGMCSGCRCCVHRHQCGSKTTSEECKLSELHVGDSAIIQHVNMDDHQALRRFYERGLKPQASISVLKESSLKGPMLLSIQGRMVAIRPEEAELFTVTPQD